MNVWWSQTMVQGVGWTLLHFLWQGLVIAALLAIGLRLLRRGPAQYRYLAGCAALLLMTLAPLVTFQLVLKQDEPAPTPVVETMVPDAPAPVEHTAPRAVTLPKIVVTAMTEARPQKISWRLEPFLPWLVAAWLLGVAGLSCRLFAGWLQIRRLRRADAEALADGWPDKLAELARRLGVNRPLRLLRTACVEVPTVIGWLRPVILLPAACLTGLTPAQLESILAHELAHIRRHDYLINLLQSAVETLLFYHPAVWWVSRRIREERENCCDDLVVEVCGDRVGYARALATLEELRPASAQLALAAGGAPLLQRIRRVLGQGERSAGRPAWPLAGVLVVVLLAVTAAGLRGHRALAASDGIVAPPKIKNAAGSGSTATDPTAIMNIPKTGPNAWLVDGSNQLNQQWFWYGVTNPGNGAVHAESNASSQAGMFNWTVGGANAINKSESMSESNRVLFNQAWELYKKLNAERGHDTSNGTLYVQLNTSNQSGGGSNLLDQASSGGGSNQVQVNRLIQDGKFYFEAGKYSEADARFTQALKLDPANLVASQYVALIGEKRDLNALNNPPSSPNPFNRTNLVYTGKGRQIIFDKLNRIRIDKVNYANLPLKDVLDDLMKITKDRDPGGKGINFFFDRESPRATNAAPAIDPATGLRVGGADESDVSQVRVNISLNDVRLADVLDAITKTSDRPIKYSVLDYAIVFALRGDGGPLEIRTFLVDPNTFIQGLESVTGKALGGGTGAGVNVVPGGGGGTGGSAGGVGGLGGGGAIGGSGGGQAFVTPVTTSTVTSNIQSAVRQYFTAAGVDLNTNLGKVVIYNERRGTLTIRATSLDLDVIEAAIQTLNTPTTPTTRTNQSAALQTRTFRVDPRIFLTGFQGDSGKPLAGGDAGSNTNSAEIQRAIRRYFGNAGVDLSTNAGKVVIFNDRKSTLTVRATPQDLDLIEAAVAQLNQPVPQVNIKAKFVEITQDDRGALGFEWNIGGFRYDAPTNNGSSNMSDSNGQPQGAVYFPTGPLKIDSKTNVATTNSVPIVGPQKSTEVASITGILTDPQYRAVLQAFDQRTSVNTLSMNITTESGRQAQMQSGDVQNITVFDGTNSKVKEFHLGPALDVLAEVSADEFTVHVDLTPSVTEFLGYDKVGSVIPPGGSNATNAALVPRFRVQQVHTTVNVWDGQTVVIGGIAPYDDTRQVKDKVPLLGDIPLLGRLFQSEHSQKVKKNLMVFVTVTIINPDGTRYHSDAEMPFVKTSVPPQAGTNAPPKR